MLGSIKELEKDIELFQQNVAASGELQGLLNRLLENIKQQNSDFNAQSSALISRIDNIPSSIEADNAKCNAQIKYDIDTELQVFFQKYVDEQGKYIAILEKTQDKLTECEEHLSVNYSEFIAMIRRMNISNLYDQNLKLKSELNKRTTILMIISAISVIIGIIGLVL